MKVTALWTTAAIGLASLLAATSGATECNANCPEIYQPVCGSDGNTYENKCSFEYHKCSTNDTKLTITKQEACSNEGGSGSGSFDCSTTMCITLYDPVCASNGKTYSNECTFNIARCKDKSLSIKSKGECPDGTSSGDGLGTVKPPESDCVKPCTKEMRPVCGSDGHTYNNPCLLENAKCSNPSLTQLRMGACYEGASAHGSITGGNAGVDTLIGDSSGSISDKCDKPCTKEYQPVCGSDGKTYSNKCRLQIAQCQNNSIVSVSNGECKHNTSKDIESTSDGHTMGIGVTIALMTVVMAAIGVVMI